MRDRQSDAAAGVGLIFVGIALALMDPHQNERARTPKPLWIGIGLGLVTFFAQLVGGLFAQSDVGIGTTLNTTTPVLILPMVWAVYRRLPAPFARVGAALVVAGTSLISTTS